MTTPISQHEGKKYLRKITSAPEGGTEGPSIFVDVYAVLEAFGVTCPAVAHCIKKLLCAGQRGKGGTLQDLIGAEAALSRAIELQRQREADKKATRESFPYYGCSIPAGLTS